MKNDETTRLNKILAQHPEDIGVFEHNGVLSKEAADILREQYPALSRAGTFQEAAPVESFDEIIAALESEGCGDLAKELHQILYAPEKDNEA